MGLLYTECTARSQALTSKYATLRLPTYVFTRSVPYQNNEVFTVINPQLTAKPRSPHNKHSPILSSISCSSLTNKAIQKVTYSYSFSPQTLSPRTRGPTEFLSQAQSSLDGPMHRAGVIAGFTSRQSAKRNTHKAAPVRTIHQSNSQLEISTAMIFSSIYHSRPRTQPNTAAPQTRKTPNSNKPPQR